MGLNVNKKWESFSETFCKKLCLPDAISYTYDTLGASSFAKTNSHFDTRKLNDNLFDNNINSLDSISCS